MLVLQQPANMDNTHDDLMDKVKNDTASESDWELLSTSGRLNDLSSYFLSRCPEYLRPGYLQSEPQPRTRSPTKSLSGLPAHIPDTYAEDDDDSMENGDLDQGDLANALITACSSNGNEEDDDPIARLRNSEHFRTIQQALVAGVGNRPSSFQLKDTVGTANVDEISFAVRPGKIATFNKGTRRVGSTYIAPPQPLAISDVDYDTEAESDEEDEPENLPKVIAKPAAVTRNYLGGLSIAMIEEPETTIPEESSVTSVVKPSTSSNVEALVPTHLVCTICQDDLSAFWDKDHQVPKEDLTKHYDVCWKERPRTPPKMSDVNTAQYMGTKNLCTVSKAEATKAPSRIPNLIHCASCNKDLVEMNVVDAIVHKANCFQAYCVQQEAWICPICHEDIAGLEYDEDYREYQRLRHVDFCNGLRIRNEAMAEKHLQLYQNAQGVMQRIDWATNSYRDRYGKKPVSRGDRMREVKDKFILEKNKFPVGRSTLRNEILVSGEVFLHGDGCASQVELPMNKGLFQRTPFSVTDSKIAVKIAIAIESDSTRAEIKKKRFVAAEQRRAVIKQMQLDGEKKVVEVNRKWLASLRKEQHLEKEEDDQLAVTLEVEEDQDDLSELSFIDPADLEAGQRQSDTIRDRSTSPERESGSDSDELPISGATTPEDLLTTAITKPQTRNNDKDRLEMAADWATKVQEAFDAPTLLAVEVEVYHAKRTVTVLGHSFADKQELPKNLQPSKSEAKKLRCAAEKARQKQFEQAYALFWGEELPVTWTESQDLADEPSTVLLFVLESGGDQINAVVSDTDTIKVIEVTKSEKDVQIDSDIDRLPDQKKLASTLKERHRISRAKEQYKLERAANKAEKKASVHASRRQRMLERARAKAPKLAELVWKEEEVGQLKLLPLQIRIHGLARVVAGAEDEAPGMAGHETEIIDEELVIMPLRVSAELICGEELPRIDSGNETSSSSDEEDVSTVTGGSGEYVEAWGEIEKFAAVDTRIFKPIWTSPLHSIRQNVQRLTVLDRMRARAMQLFAGNVE